MFKFRKEILEEIDKELKKYLDKDNNLYKAAKHLTFAGGKRIRPYLSILTYNLKKDNINEILPAAVSVELIHNYTLIHDDIMDNDELRRGKPTVHIAYGEEMAILAGDLLYAKAFEAIGNIKDEKKAYKVLKVLSKACVDVCEGQAMDMEFESYWPTLEEYLEMIKKKTGALLEASAEIGGIMAEFNEEEMKAIKSYAEKIGLTFQIQDDILDIIGDEKKIGKPVGSDIREGKKTIIIIHAINTLNEEEKEKLLSILGNVKSEEDIREAIKILEPSINYAKELLNKLTEEAIKSLEIFDKYRRKELEELAKFIANRIY
ncbi:Polyprenyl synthetase [Methanocaldococcus infernus ME]|uniref:Polyprenyl synthetase n=1 Tax=Methanocaldococcus infernus (strain DSM 11812 / JCM 15783 / ME) TaxID=573063 RepID=D5VSA1_METIM|nr:polyprenyl synthetase family protein [Methanocaldococcus infernus]ADG13454.1 Polyprenyl synthetase [Methanocaldococcus infernus ME]